MKTAARLLTVLILPLVMTGCFLAPGNFGSTLDIRKDGTFTYAYKGEIIFQTPDEFDKKPMDEAWKDENAVCYGPLPGKKQKAVTAAQAAAEAAEDAAKAASGDENRACTKEEIAEQKAEWEDSQKASVERKKKDSEQFAAIFGFSPNDDAANQKFAAQLMKFEGWKSVTYRGKGVFDVDYQITAKLGYDYVFPSFPQGSFIIPFVQIRKREGGGALVSGTGLIGGGLRGLAAQAKMLGAGDAKDVPQATRTNGTFTITTDGEILTNNTEDGPKPSPRGKQLVWTIDPKSEKAPEALIKLQ